MMKIFPIVFLVLAAIIYHQGNAKSVEKTPRHHHQHHHHHQDSGDYLTHLPDNHLHWMVKICENDDCRHPVCNGVRLGEEEDSPVITAAHCLFDAAPEYGRNSVDAAVTCKTNRFIQGSANDSLYFRHNNYVRHVTKRKYNLTNYDVAIVRSKTTENPTLTCEMPTLTQNCWVYVRRPNGTVKKNVTVGECPRTDCYEDECDSSCIRGDSVLTNRDSGSPVYCPALSQPNHFCLRGVVSQKGSFNGKDYVVVANIYGKIVKGLTEECKNK